MNLFPPLPNDVVYYLFSFLDIKSLGKIGRVCKVWLKVSERDFLWKKSAATLNISEEKNLKKLVISQINELKENAEGNSEAKLILFSLGVTPQYLINGREVTLKRSLNLEMNKKRGRIKLNYSNS